MKLSHLINICSLASAGLAVPTRKTDHLQGIIANAESIYNTNTLNWLNQSASSCNPDSILLRKAWDDLSSTERSEYLHAVQCVASKPARTSPDLAPGAKTWWDDFTYIHINQTNFVHQSGLLLPWHRQFLWAWEQTLRTDCGYTGALPYWAWERHSSNQLASPVFQSDSFGGDGAAILHAATNQSSINLDPPIFFARAAGTGGGCVTDVVFVNHTVNLGPVNDNHQGTDYNPRCLRRDFLQDISSQNLTYETIANLYQTSSIHEFFPLLENIAHLSSHFFLGGDGIDVYSSPNEPVFWLLHCQIDRLWTIWQGQDLENRLTALDGTLTILNNPPSQNATLDSIMTMGVAAGGDLPISHAMNSVGGDYCYMYT